MLCCVVELRGRVVKSCCAAEVCVDCFLSGCVVESREKVCVVVSELRSGVVLLSC